MLHYILHVSLCADMLHDEEIKSQLTLNIHRKSDSYYRYTECSGTVKELSQNVQMSMKCSTVN